MSLDAHKEEQDGEESLLDSMDFIQRHPYHVNYYLRCQRLHSLIGNCWLKSIDSGKTE